MMRNSARPRGRARAILAHGGYALIYRCIAALFAVCAALIVGFAVLEVMEGLLAEGAPLQHRFSSVLEAVGMLTIAVAVLELSQTV